MTGDGHGRVAVAGEKKVGPRPGAHSSKATRYAPQTLLFRRIPVGPGVPLLVNPIVADAPGASVEFHDGAAAVTVVPLCETVAFQPLLIVAPAGIVQVAVHGESAAVLLLRTVTSPWKPPDHWLLIRVVAVHVCGPLVDGGGLVGGADVGGVEVGGGLVGGGEVGGVPPNCTSTQL